MKTKQNNLRHYLTTPIPGAEKCLLDTEQLAIGIEQGTVNTQWHDEETVVPLFQNGQLVGFRPDESRQHLVMTLEYRMNVHVTQYGGDEVVLLAFIAHWLEQNTTQSKISFDGPEANNNQTVDVWLDIDVTEVWRDQDGKLVTCA